MNKEELKVGDILIVNGDVIEITQEMLPKIKIEHDWHYCKWVKEMSTEELENELERLHKSLDKELSMDGSGELGGVIHKNYEPYFGTILKLLSEKDDYNPHKGEYGSPEDELPF